MRVNVQLLGEHVETRSLGWPNSSCWFVSYLVDVGQRLLVLGQHLCKLQALVRIDTHHVSQQENPVRGVANLEM